MKSTLIKIIFIIVIIIILGAIVLNLFPGLEAELHRITGWN